MEPRCPEAFAGAIKEGCAPCAGGRDPLSSGTVTSVPSVVTQQGSTERTGDRELERMPRGRQGGSRVPFVSQSLRSSSRTGCGDFIRAARVPHVELGKWGTRQAEPGPLGEHLTMGSSLQKTTGFRGESRLAVEAGLFCEALQSGARSCPQPPADTSTHPWTPQEAQRALGAEATGQAPTWLCAVFQWPMAVPLRNAARGHWGLKQLPFAS